jgi:succinoglycan biosynthesis transport protein ExoP
LNLTTAEKTFDLREYLKLIWRRKILIILPFLIVTGVGIWGSYQLTPIFQSATTIMIIETKLLARSLEAMIPGGEGNQLSGLRKDQRLAAMEAQILSSQTLKELISKLELDKQPWVVKSKALLEKKKSPLSAQEPVVEKMLMDNLRKNISVDLKGENLLEIKVTSPSPEKAAQMAEALTDIFIKQSLEDELLGIKQTTNFSDEQLEYYKTQLQASEDSLREFKAKYLQTEPGDTISQRNRMVEIGSLLAATKLQIEDFKKQLEDLAQQIRKQSIEIPNLLTSKSLEEKKSQLFAQTRQYAELLISTSVKDIQALALNMKIEETFKDIEKEVKRLADSQIKGELQNFRSQIEQYNLKSIRKSYLEEKSILLNQTYAWLKGAQSKRIYNESVLRNLEHEVEMNRRIYELFVSQAQGSQISQQMLKTVSENRFKIIEPAKIPIAPIRPDKRKIALFSGLIGLMIGIGAVIIAETLDHSFKDVEEVESYLNLKVLGTVSRVNKLTQLLKK